MQRTLTRAGLIGVLAFSSLIFADAQVTKSGNGHLLRVRYTKGQAMDYTVTTSVTVPGAQGQQPARSRITAPLSMRVQDVARGIATVKIESGPAMVDGKPQGQKTETTVRLDNRNQPQGQAGGGVESMAAAILPANAVTVGQRWTSTATVNVMNQPMNLSVTYTFRGVRRVGGRDVAEIQAQYTGKGFATFTGSGTTLLRVADGTLQSSVVSLRANISAGQNTATNVTMEMNVVRK
jgi:hypothetical protein